MVRCYDCGQKIAEGQVVRRMVRTGWSIGSWSSHDYYRKVNLCPTCAANRDEARMGCLFIFGGLVFTLILAAIVRAIGG